MAAWEAWKQGKFWEMHDLLFEKSPKLYRKELEKLAEQLDLNMTDFRRALDTQKYMRELQEKLNLAHELDIWSTPTIIINGTIIKGAQPYEVYKQAIDEALGKSGARNKTSSLSTHLLRALLPGKAHAGDKVFGQGKVPQFIKVGPLKPINEPRVGEPAPDFTLPSIFNQKITLSDYRGKKNVLLTFMPAAFTPV
jgi:hypothetical protein